MTAEQVKPLSVVESGDGDPIEEYLVARTRRNYHRAVFARLVGQTVTGDRLEIVLMDPDQEAKKPAAQQDGVMLAGWAQAAFLVHNGVLLDYETETSWIDLIVRAGKGEIRPLIEHAPDA